VISRHVLAYFIRLVYQNFVFNLFKRRGKYIHSPGIEPSTFGVAVAGSVNPEGGLKLKYAKLDWACSLKRCGYL
jgi:hypothetical protein